MKVLALVGAVLAAFFANNSFAETSADYTPFRIMESSEQVIALDGPIDFRSPLAFRRILAARPNAKALFLNSVGGSVQGALLIAEEVHERGLSTLIPPKSECLSACSFIFFAGNARVALGSLGVHQISGGSDIQNAQLNLSDILETLAKYDVHQGVITRMLRTAPDDMYVFTQQEIVDLGVNRDIKDVSPSSSRPPTVQEDSPSQTTPATKSELTQAEQHVQKFVLTLIAASGSLSKASLVNVSSRVYADLVEFYGKQLTKQQVLEDKAIYAERWPVRSSTTRPSTVATQCSGTVCRVAGIYDWEVLNPKKRKSSRGAAAFEYRVQMKGDRLVIIGEDGKVLERGD